jgi:cytochrome c biogenesis protein CcmG, thiol:disulfide interchange protein DsbE
MSDGAPDQQPPATGWRRWRQGRRVSRLVIAVTATCLALVVAVIVIDATTSRATPHVDPRAPAFTLPSLRDPRQQVSLSSFAGRPLIVNFFASWCGPCKKETPLLARFYRQKAGTVVIVGVDANDKAPAARRLVQADAVGYPIAFESTPATADAYGVAAIPQTFFLNARHRIVKRIYGDVTMKELTAGVALMDGKSQDSG